MEGFAMMPLENERDKPIDFICLLMGALRLFNSNKKIAILLCSSHFNFKEFFSFFSSKMWLAKYTAFETKLFCNRSIKKPR